MKFLIRIIIFCLLINNVWAQDGTWTQLETKGPAPSPRSSPGLELIDNYIYLYGGVKDDFNTGVYPIYTDIYRLNLQNNTWEEVKTKGEHPPPRAFNAITYAKDKNQIIIFGGNSFGKNFSKFKSLNDMWSYSLHDQTWHEIKPLNAPPSGRGSPMEWRVGNKWYFFGGISNWYQMLNDFWMYDIDTNKWTQLRANKATGSPPGRYMEETRGAELIWKGDLILPGGESLNIWMRKDISLNDIWAYNIKENKWNDLTPKGKDNIAEGQNSASAGIIDDYLYVQGGDIETHGEEGCNAPFPQSVSNELWRFDLNQHIWKKLSPGGITMPSLKRTNGIVVNGKLYVFYGFDFQCKDNKGPGQIWNTKIYVYDPK